MSEATTDLVTEPAKLPEGATALDPAAAIDPAAAALDPAKVKAAPAKAKRKRTRKPAAKAPAKKTAKEAADKAANAVEFKDAADVQHQHATHAEGVAAFDAAVAHQVDSFAKLPETGALVLRLADVAPTGGDPDVVASGLFHPGSVAVTRSDFVPEGDRMVLAKAIDIGPGGNPVRVSEAWIIAENGAAIGCAVGPLTGGNGHHAQIPSGHLIF